MIIGNIKQEIKVEIPDICGENKGGKFTVKTNYITFGSNDEYDVRTFDENNNIIPNNFQCQFAVDMPDDFTNKHMTGKCILKLYRFDGSVVRLIFFGDEIGVFGDGEGMILPDFNPYGEGTGLPVIPPYMSGNFGRYSQFWIQASEDSNIVRMIRPPQFTLFSANSGFNGPRWEFLVEYIETIQEEE